MRMGRRCHRSGRPGSMARRQGAVESAELMLLQLGLLLRGWSMESILNRGGGHRYCGGCVSSRLPPGRLVLEHDL